VVVASHRLCHVAAGAGGYASGVEVTVLVCAAATARPGCDADGEQVWWVSCSVCQYQISNDYFVSIVLAMAWRCLKVWCGVCLQEAAAAMAAAAGTWHVHIWLAC